MDQPVVLDASFWDVVSMTAVAFWLFIGAEYDIPISKNVKNAKRNVPLGMMIGLVVICIMQSIMIFGFHNYVDWGELADSAAPHMLPQIFTKTNKRNVPWILKVLHKFFIWEYPFIRYS